MESRVSAALQSDNSTKAEVREKKLLKTCQEFGSMLVSYMIKTMRAASSDGDDKDFASGVYQDMFYDQVAKVVGQSNSLGLGSMLCSQLDRLEKAHATQNPSIVASEAQKALSLQLSLNKFGNSSE